MQIPKHNFVADKAKIRRNTEFVEFSLFYYPKMG